MTTQPSVTVEKPASLVGHIVTMRDLSQRTAQIMREITKSQEPVLVTLRGRFVAAIMPLAEGEWESKLVSAVLAEAATKTEGFLSSTDEKSTEEFAKELGISLDEDPASKVTP